MKLALGLYGLYLLLVAVNGNASELFTELRTDGGSFLPWLIVAAVLGAGYQYPQTHQFASAFLLLVVLAFFLENWPNLKSQFTAIYAKATGK